MFETKRRLYQAVKFEPASTLARLVALVREGEAKTQVEAAEKLGVSKQRIHQLVKEYGLSLKRPPLTVPVVCCVCGRPFQRSASSPDAGSACFTCLHPRLVFTCRQCGRSRLLRKGDYDRQKSSLCGSCWRRGLGQHWKREHALRGPPAKRVTLVCSSYGKERLVKESDARRKKTGLCFDCWIETLKREGRPKRGEASGTAASPSAIR